MRSLFWLIYLVFMLNYSLLHRQVPLLLAVHNSSTFLDLTYGDIFE